MKFTEELLIEIQDHINDLNEQVGLKPETIKDIDLAISKQLKELNQQNK